MIYQKFDKFYDELFDETMYDKWLSYVKDNVTKDESIMDMACGTGRLLSFLSDEGYQVSGMDLSDDMITCFDDSLCYLPNQNVLQTAFEKVHEHLNNDGQFLFDVITPYQTDVVYPGYMYNYHDDSNAFMWQSYLGDEDHSIEHDLVFFKYNETISAYDQFSEIHLERTYKVGIYIDLLKNAGFKDIKVSANFGKDEITDTTTRWFFVCKKG